MIGRQRNVSAFCPAHDVGGNTFECHVVHGYRFRRTPDGAGSKRRVFSSQETERFPDPCRLARQVKETGWLMSGNCKVSRPLPACPAGESDWGLPDLQPTSLFHLPDEPAGVTRPARESTGAKVICRTSRQGLPRSSQAANNDATV